MIDKQLQNQFPYRHSASLHGSAQEWGYVLSCLRHTHRWRSDNYKILYVSCNCPG